MIHDYNEDVSLWVRNRIASGVTQQQISEDTGLSQQMISAFEKLQKRSFPLYYYYKHKFGGEKNE